MLRRIYLDNSATTQVDPEVLDAMLPFLKDKFGNASSIHHFGQEARGAVDRARHQVAGMINARPSEIVFTSGGTESNNLAIRGIVDIERQRANASTPHIVTTAIEHPAVLNVCEDLERSGCSVTYVKPSENGIVTFDDLNGAINDNTLLISVMTANNEIGTLQPVEQIGRLVRELRDRGRRLFLHTDAVQAVGKVAVDVEEIGCDLLSLSGHKIHAPKGVGALFVRRGVRLHSQNLGGPQERQRRGGTEAVPNIVALGKACELASEKLADTVRIRGLRDRLEEGVFERVSGVSRNGDAEQRVPTISNLSFTGVEGEGLLINLDMQGIAVSTGSACSSGSLEPSPVIRAIGREDALARSAIRFSFGRFNTADDVDRLLEVLPSAIESLRRLAPVNSVTGSV
jgi:cysteine desulfurase